MSILRENEESSSVYRKYACIFLREKKRVCINRTTCISITERWQNSMVIDFEIGCSCIYTIERIPLVNEMPFKYSLEIRFVNGFEAWLISDVIHREFHWTRNSNSITKWNCFYSDSVRWRSWTMSIHKNQWFKSQKKISISSQFHFEMSDVHQQIRDLPGNDCEKSMKMHRICAFMTFKVFPTKQRT